jgi:hypothetical protein
MSFIFFHFEFRVGFGRPVRINFVILVHLSGSVERELALNQTWLSNLPKSVAIVKFGTKLSQGTSFMRTKSGFNKVLELFPDTQYIAKFDDDSYVFVHNLIQKLNILGSDHLYAGFPLCCNHGVKYASGGAGYVLARNVAAKLKFCDSNISPYEDVGVGKCLLSHGIFLTDFVGLHPATMFQMLLWDRERKPPPDHIRGTESIEGYELPLSYHYVSPQEMRLMHQNNNYACQLLKDSIFKHSLESANSIRLRCP